MATIPNPSPSCSSGARRRADRRRRDRPAGHLSADPAVRRRADLPDLVDASSAASSSTSGRTRRSPLSITDPIAVGGRDGPGDDPGRRPGHRRGPARRLGTPAADLGGEGARDRLLPQGAGRAAALLRAGADRDHAAPRPVLARRRRSGRAGDRRPSERRPRDAHRTPGARRPEPASRSSPPIPSDRDLGRRRRLSGQRRRRRRASTRQRHRDVRARRPGSPSRPIATSR